MTKFKKWWREILCVFGIKDCPGCVDLADFPHKWEV